MKISISALSIAYGLTPEALRYYEEKGLLSPDRAASSGFRRFSIADVQRLGIIKSLQRQGFSLDEIKRILTKCALSDLIVMMDEKRAALREQIAQQNAVYERMTSGTDLLRDCRRLLMQPRLCMGCAAYLVDFDSVPALWTAVPKMPFLKDLIDALPLTNYCTTVPLALLNGQSAATRIGIVAPVEFTHVIHADFSQMRMSAGPQAVKIIFDLCPPAQARLRGIHAPVRMVRRSRRADAPLFRIDRAGDGGISPPSCSARRARPLRRTYTANSFNARTKSPCCPLYLPRRF